MNLTTGIAHVGPVYAPYVPASFKKPTLGERLIDGGYIDGSDFSLTDSEREQAARVVSNNLDIKNLQFTDGKGNDYELRVETGHDTRFDHIYIDDNSTGRPWVMPDPQPWQPYTYPPTQPVTTTQVTMYPQPVQEEPEREDFWEDYRTIVTFIPRVVLAVLNWAVDQTRSSASQCAHTWRSLFRKPE